jgi:transposase InsO family protein
MTKEDRDIQRKLKVLRHAEKTGHVAKTCRYFGVGRSSFYRWKAAYEQSGETGLVNAKPIPKNPANQTPPEIVDKILCLRSKYHLGSIRIVRYLARYHGITISDAGVTRILRRNGVGRLPRGTRMRKVHTKRYNKQVPGHHIQMDVKFLTFTGKHREKIRRFQYAAIDDATRVRALKVYDKHTQTNAINFVDHIIEKFPFRIKEIRTGNGHEFQAKFYWHVEDQGIRHAYIKRGTPQLNGKVERSHRSDQQAFYQRLSYKGDVDLEAKLSEWENFYNFNRPHGAFNGKTPYQALRERL